MMDEKLNELFYEAIELESNASALYEIFRHAFPEDAPFWGRLMVEEKNHAALLQSGSERFSPIGKFPRQLLPETTEELVLANRQIKALIEAFNKAPFGRDEALRRALSLEETAGELHFQRFMEKEDDSVLDGIFRRLNRDDKDHADRIRAYMKERGISV